MSDLALEGGRIADLFVENGGPNEIAVVAFICGFLTAYAFNVLRGRR